MSVRDVDTGTQKRQAPRRYVRVREKLPYSLFACT
jgi:hypothetical protein